MINLLVITTLLTALWCVSVALRDVSIIDIFWGLGFVVIAWVTFAGKIGHHGDLRGLERLPEPHVGLPVLLLTLTTIWGLRLTVHLGWRTYRRRDPKQGHREDRRYAAMRMRDPQFWWTSLFKVFWLQAVLLWIVSLPVQFGIQPNAWSRPLPAPWSYTVVALGIGLWLIGLLFETLGDLQLATFTANPQNRGRVLRTGLWRYTRHPNYFGDFCVWWGLFSIALVAGAWWTVVGPALISFLLLRVSGVTMLEHDIELRRPGYADYIRRTSPFFPRRPL